MIRYQLRDQSDIRGSFEAFGLRDAYEDRFLLFVLKRNVYGAINPFDAILPPSVKMFYLVLFHLSRYVEIFEIQPAFIAFM